MTLNLSNLATDRADDPDWDWTQTYSAQVVQRYGARLGAVDHLKVKRHDHRDGIPWDMLQRIKNEVLGTDVLAVEFYPPADEVVNGVNMRHLWVVPEPLEAWYRDISLSRP